MHITHIVLNYHPSVGGTQWLFQNISERLVKNYGDEVTVLTINSYYGSEKKVFKKIIPSSEIFNEVKIERFAFVRWYLPLLRFILKVCYRLSKSHSEIITEYIYGPTSTSLKKAISNNDADVICGSSSAYSFTRYPLWRKKLKNPKPYICMGAIHFSENEKEKVITNRALKAIKAADYYIANTEFEKIRLVNLGVDTNNIEVIGCGVEPLEYQNGNRTIIRQKLNIADDEILIGFVGRQVPFKNIDVLIEAVQQARLTNKKIKLLIAGAYSSYTKHIEEVIKVINQPSPSVYLITDISEEVKVNIFHAIDVFVSASDSESFGIIFVEAWACKKPIIATNIGAIRSLVSDDVDGLLVAPKNTYMLGQAIIKLANNSQLRERLGNNGYKKMITNYTWDVVTAKYRNVYIKAIEKFKI
ncbi:MAG: glycosyltransferase family 4 protein [Pedobacter sp.]|nr:glycosyltransferase family 4 protein [Chitinophagaceae bacterium]